METVSKQELKAAIVRELLDSLQEKDNLARLVKAVEANDIEAALRLFDADGGLKAARNPRVPGRYKGRLSTGPEFFAPLSDEEIRELTGE